MSTPDPLRVAIRWDTVLGIVRYCPGCRTWQPSDHEFFYMERRGDRLIPRCRTCRAETARRSNQRHHAARADAVRARRMARRPVLLGPVACRSCGAQVTWDGSRWNDRLRRHACAQRTAAA